MTVLEADLRRVALDLEENNVPSLDDSMPFANECSSTWRSTWESSGSGRGCGLFRLFSSVLGKLQPRR